jgi:thioredoxin-related protein
MRFLILITICLFFIGGYGQQTEATGQRFVQTELLTFLPSASVDKHYIVIFLGTDCPISQKYMHTLREMHKRYSETITFFGIIPANFSEEQLLVFKKEYTIPFKLVKDHGNNFAAVFKATVTPEAFFFDGLGQIYYDGAIDDWFYALGRNRLKPAAHYLEDAIKDHNAGRMVATPHADAVGCLIEYRKP